MSLSQLTVEGESCTRSVRLLKRSLLNKKDRLLEETGFLYSLKIYVLTDICSDAALKVTVQRWIWLKKKVHSIARHYRVRRGGVQKNLSVLHPLESLKVSTPSPKCVGYYLGSNSQRRHEIHHAVGIGRK